MLRRGFAAPIFKPWLGNAGVTAGDRAAAGVGVIGAVLRMLVDSVVAVGGSLTMGGAGARMGMTCGAALAKG